MKRTSLLLAAVSAIALAGCTLAPDYERPEQPVAKTYPTGPAYQADPATATTPAEAIGWRDFFADQRLQALIDIALKNNRDLRIAVLNVESAQAQFRSTQAGLFPSISASGNGEIENLPGGTTTQTTSTAGSSGHSMYRYYQAGIGFTSYELDLFGKVQSQTEQQFEEYLGYDETRRSSQISLVAQVASAYLTLLADEKLLKLTEDTLNSQRDSYAITSKTLDNGTGTELDVRQAETSVDTAEANLEQYTRQLAQDRNALELLLGQAMPDNLPAGKSIDEQGFLAELPAGLPSALLENRPDIVAAEHDLKAANANIGAARAAFFPSIDLTASYGVASNQLSNLFKGGSTTWSFAPAINIPIFTWGQNEANLDLAKAQKNIQVATYEKTIQTAFEEVANALAARGTYLKQIKAQQKLVTAYSESYRLSELRFRNGIDNYLTVLDAQRSLYSAQQSLVSLQQASLSNQVTFYKALGGGWKERS